MVPLFQVRFSGQNKQNYATCGDCSVYLSTINQSGYGIMQDVALKSSLKSFDNGKQEAET